MNCIQELYSLLCPIHYLASVILFISYSKGVNEVHAQFVHDINFFKEITNFVRYSPGP